MEVLELAVVGCRVESIVVGLDVGEQAASTADESSMVVHGVELEVVVQVDVHVGEVEEEHVVASVGE